MFQTQSSLSERGIMKKKTMASWYFLGVEPQRGQYRYVVKETAKNRSEENRLKAPAARRRVSYWARMTGRRAPRCDPIS
jgi:hypothetical protein